MWLCIIDVDALVAYESKHDGIAELQNVCATLQEGFDIIELCSGSMRSRVTELSPGTENGVGQATLPNKIAKRIRLQHWTKCVANSVPQLIGKIHLSDFFP